MYTHLYICNISMNMSTHLQAIVQRLASITYHLWVRVIMHCILLSFIHSFQLIL